MAVILQTNMTISIFTVTRVILEFTLCDQCNHFRSDSCLEAVYADTDFEIMDFKLTFLA